MHIAFSKIGPRGQLTLPLAVRRRLKLAPGDRVEWCDDEGRILVRKEGGFTSEDMHNALFPGGAPPRLSAKQMKAALVRRFSKRR